MISVSVRLFATLRKYYPEVGKEGMSVELPEGATVQDLIQSLNLPPKQVKIIFVNGIVRDPDYVLQDGDDLGIFPPVGGG